MFGIRRREFITLLGGAAAAWPLAARAQQPRAMRRIGVLSGAAATDLEIQARNAARFGRRCSNWAGPTAATCGSTIAGSAAMPTDIRRYAAELVALAPDVILATGSPNVGALRKATRTVPIVFVGVIDPVGAGFVDSLARPRRQCHGLHLRSNTA